MSLWQRDAAVVCRGNDTFATSSSARRAERPRVSRDLTVPRLTFEDLGDLFVGEAFDLAEDDDGAEGLGQLPEGGFDALANFSLGGVIVRANRRGRPELR